MGRGFKRDQNVILAMMVLSFILAAFGIEVSRIGAFPVRVVCIALAIALMPLTFAVLRKVYDILDAVLWSSLGGLLPGVGVGFVGLYIVHGQTLHLVIGIKWLIIGSIFLFMGLRAIKQLGETKTSSPFPEVDLDSMSEIERLRHFERIFAEEALDPTLRKTSWDPVGIGFVIVSLVSLGVLMFELKTSQDRWLYGGSFAAVAVVGWWIMLRFRRKSTIKVNEMLDEVDDLRKKTLLDVRRRLSELEHAE